MKKTGALVAAGGAVPPLDSGTTAPGHRASRLRGGTNVRFREISDMTPQVGLHRVPGSRLRVYGIRPFFGLEGCDAAHSSTLPGLTFRRQACRHRQRRTAQTPLRGMLRTQSRLDTGVSPSNAFREALTSKVVAVQETSVRVTVRTRQSPRDRRHTALASARVAAGSLSRIR